MVSLSSCFAALARLDPGDLLELSVKLLKCVLRQLRRCSSFSRLKQRGNAATGAPFVDWVLDSRLRGNDEQWRMAAHRAKESEVLIRAPFNSAAV